MIRVEKEEEVGHASAVLLDTKLDCFQGLQAWVVRVIEIHVQIWAGKKSRGLATALETLST